VRVTATTAALIHLVVLASGAGPLMMGELAEQWTATELRRLQRSGWRVVNHFGLATGDIDHVVVGTPGVFVIETKWSASSWTEKWAQEDVEAAYSQAERAAKRMTMWENYKRLRLPEPLPLVAIWGAGSADLANALNHPSVIAGPDLPATLESQALIKPRLTVDQLDNVWQVLSDHLRKRDVREALDSPMPVSLQALAFRLASGVVAGLVSFLAAGYLLKTGLPLWSWFVIVLATVPAELSLRRWTHLRAMIAGSQTGFVLTALLVAAVAGAQVVR
jgi:roadblock/LC7 domain-containing protein